MVSTVPSLYSDRTYRTNPRTQLQYHHCLNLYSGPHTAYAISVPADARSVRGSAYRARREIAAGTRSGWFAAFLSSPGSAAYATSVPHSG
eukprot:3814284-Rhodomonas_salina.1